jgi:ribosomal-protein-alanine N-acetyltransferase
MSTPQQPAPSSPDQNPTIRIEPVRWSDISELVTIQRESFRPTLAYGRFALSMLKVLPNTSFLVARTNDRNVAGCVIGDIHRGNARVMNIAVHPQARRQGIGAALLRHIEQEIPTGNVVLVAEEHNTGAQALYEREGYVRDGRATNYYGRNRHGIWMKKLRTQSPDSNIRV